MRQVEANSLLCVGLDPLVEKIPEGFSGAGKTIAERVGVWMKCVVNNTAPFASMFKPQSAHWEAIHGGVEALAGVVDFIHHRWPGIPVFLDCKRGDIDRTQERYRLAHLDMLGADGMNFSPYMGDETIAALVDKDNPGKAIVAVCYTSNKGGRRFQDALLSDNRPLWEHIAEWTLQWAKELGIVADAGLVMASAYENPKGSGNIYSEHLVRCRQLVGDKLWFLIPGIGTQGGFVEETVRASYKGPGSIAINSSSGIIFAEDPAGAARSLRDSINSALNT